MPYFFGPQESEERAWIGIGWVSFIPRGRRL